MLSFVWQHYRAGTSASTLRIDGRACSACTARHSVAGEASGFGACTLYLKMRSLVRGDLLVTLTALLTVAGMQ